MVVVLCLLGVGIWYKACVNFVDNYQLGFTFHKFGGEVKILNYSGWVVVNPWSYQVHTIDLRPYQVTISANERILNAKLVKFDPAGLDTFVKWHGRDAGDKTYNMLEILKCYAFDRDEGRDCPFLTVLSVLAPNQGVLPTTNPLKR